MFRSLYVGRAFGIPLFIHPTFLLIVLWVLYQNQSPDALGYFLAAAIVLTVFGCVLLHELGHALMARYFGIRTRDITLYPIGGVARLERLSEKPHEELCIALAGPAVNVVIAALLTPVIFFAAAAGVSLGHMDELTLASPPSAIFAAYVLSVLGANIFLVVFNMIPAFPMDGGRVLRSILASWLGQVRATDIAARLGLVIAVLLAIVALLRHQPFLLLISFFVAFVGHMERLAVRYHDARRRQEAEQYANGAVYPVPFPEAERATAVTNRPPHPVTTYPAVNPARGFSGVAWDGQYHVWVRWVDGRPVGYYAPTE